MYEAFAEALVAEPTGKSQDKMRRIAQQLERPLPPDGLALPALARRFYDRFLVAPSPYYVSATESTMRDAACSKGTWQLAPGDGRHMTHVVCCYRAIGFDQRKLSGCEALVRTMRPDHIGVEAAFMAYALHREADADAGAAAEAHEGADAEATVPGGSFADAFLAVHLCRWTAALARYASARGRDYYAGVLDAFAQWVELDAAGSPAA